MLCSARGPYARTVGQDVRSFWFFGDMKIMHAIPVIYTVTRKIHLLLLLGEKLTELSLNNPIFELFEITINY